MRLASVTVSRVALAGGCWRVNFPKSNKEQNTAADNFNSVRLPHSEKIQHVNVLVGNGAFFF